MANHSEISPGIAQTNQRLQHRRFTGAVRSYQSTNRTLRDIKINTVESNKLAIGLPQLASANCTLGEPRSPSVRPSPVNSSIVSFPLLFSLVAELAAALVIRLYAIPVALASIKFRAILVRENADAG